MAVYVGTEASSTRSFIILVAISFADFLRSFKRKSKMKISVVVTCFNERYIEECKKYSKQSIYHSIDEICC